MYGAPDNSELKDGSIDAGLFLFDLVRDPARTYSQAEIAQVCGCSPANIAHIEHQAMKKIALEFRKRLRDLMPQKPPAYIPADIIRKALLRGNYDNKRQRWNNF
jgi:transcriptional regulator with XRE-family HTH domain